MTAGAASRARRLRLFTLLAACAVLAPLQLNVYLPGLPLVGREFAADLAAVQWTVSAAMAAFGAGLLLFGPLSDRYGRRPVLLLGLGIFTVASAGAALAPTLQTLTLARAVQSSGAALLFITARAVVADLTPREHLQRSVAQLTLLMLLGQMVGPLLGNLAMVGWGWRGIQEGLAGAGLIAALAAWRGLPETMAQGTEEGATPARSSLASALLRPSLELLRRRRFPAQLLQIGLLYCAYPAFVAIAPHLMIALFHRPETDYAWYFALLPLGYFGGNVYVLRVGRRLDGPTLIRRGATIACASALLGLALIAAGLRHPLALFLPAGLLLNFGLGLALPSATARAITRSWPSTASGWGLAGFTQQAAAASAVQVLGFFPATTAWPVLVLCAAVGAGAVVLERQFRNLPTVGTTPPLESGPR